MGRRARFPRRRRTCWGRARLRWPGGGAGCCRVAAAAGAGRGSCRAGTGRAGDGARGTGGLPCELGGARRHLERAIAELEQARLAWGCGRTSVRKLAEQRTGISVADGFGLLDDRGLCAGAADGRVVRRRGSRGGDGAGSGRRRCCRWSAVCPCLAVETANRFDLIPVRANDFGKVNLCAFEISSCPVQLALLPASPVRRPGSGRAAGAGRAEVLALLARMIARGVGGSPAGRAGGGRR